TRHSGAVFVTEVTLEMQDGTKDTAHHGILEFAHGGKAALAVAKREDHAGTLTGGNGPFRLASREGKGLLAPNRFAGSPHRNNLIDMQQMWCCQHDCLHAGIGDSVGKFGGEFEAVCGGKACNELGLLAHAAHEAQPLALALDGLDNRFSPSSEADNGGIEHECGPSV